MTNETTPAVLGLSEWVGPLPTTAEDEAVVQARLSKTPAEAYERGFLDGAAAERERWLEAADLAMRELVQAPNWTNAGQAFQALRRLVIEAKEPYEHRQG